MLTCRRNKMKRIYQLCLISSICFLLTSCGTIESATDSVVTEAPIMETTFEPEPILSPSPTIETDHFIGEYIDPETNQPGLGLQIEKDEDGYWVEIEVLGKYHVPCSLCELIDGKIKFAVASRGEFMDGTITVDDGVATVTFLKNCWDVVRAGDTFIYQKTSDIPYEQYNELIKSRPSPSIKEEDFVGEYFEKIINWPNLEIQKNEDGTFQVEFEVSRVYSISPCVGKFVDDAIEFTFQDEESRKSMKGKITLEDEYAVLTIKSDYWKKIDKTDTYYYYKVSDIPYYNKNNVDMPEE